MTKQYAADFFECTTKRIKSFEELDNFNPQNTLKGFMSLADGHHYGSFFLTHINDKKLPKPQLIYSTPKQKYPFDKQDTWRFPKTNYINIYEKYDGTNIVSYRYYNPVTDTWYITYKTRLCAIARKGKFGDFYGMWQKMLDKHPEIREAVDHTRGINLSFELYGSQNFHLVLYDVPLDYVLLFGIYSDTGEIVEVRDELKPQGVHCADRIAVIRKKTDLESYYRKIQGEIEAGNKTIEENQVIEGKEGAVWYLHTADGVVQMKCKPSTIENIHFSQGGGFSKTSILTTVYNSLENSDDLSYEFIRELLLEEFDSRLIEANKDMVLDCIKHVKDKMILKQNVLTEYKKIGISILDDKAAVMRRMSKVIPKSMIRECYAILIAEES